MMRLATCLALLMLAGAARAETALAAVATNFVTTAEKLADAFSAKSGHEIRLASGATGALFAKAVNGAPYDLLLAADRARPQRLAEDGHGVADSLFTYALGRLVLWSADPSRVTSLDVLKIDPPRRVAIANPKVAPYGVAAQETLDAMNINLSDRIVRAENIGQVYAFVATGNAEIGFIAMSADRTSGSGFAIPADLHAPIRQDAILLSRGADNPAAIAFLEYLKTPEARRLIREAGYDLP